MFQDPSLVGCWDELARHLEVDGVLRRWSRSEPELTDLTTLDGLNAAWADPVRMHPVGTALVRLAAASGGRDDDALLLLLHLLSGLVWRLVSQLRDLSPDITAAVIAELTCQLRGYHWHSRGGRLIPNLERDTRRAVLADLRPTSRYHPERVERLTWTGELPVVDDPAPAQDDLQLVDVLSFAVARGVNAADVQLLLDSERARGRRGANADAAVAAACGITRRTLLRRRERALAALRQLAPAYLAAAA